jgi:hypothetical protein
VEQAIRQVAKSVRRGVGGMIHGRLQSKSMPVRSIIEDVLATSPSLYLFFLEVYDRWRPCPNRS